MRRSALALLSAGTLLVAASCTPDRAAAPVARSLTAGQSGRLMRGDRPQADATGDSVDRVASCAPHGIAAGVGLVGPGGGTVSAGDAQLVVPAGALDLTVPVIATVPAGDASEIRFEPHGLQFKGTVRLVLPGAGCDFSGGSVWVDYLGEDGTVLESLPAHVDPQTGAVVAQIRHFSIYAVAVRQGAAPRVE